MRSVLDKIAESLEGDVTIEPDWLSDHVAILPEDHVRIDPDLWAQLAGLLCLLRPRRGKCSRRAARRPAEPPPLRWEDGSRFFLNGYECDWLWALDLTSSGTPTLDAFLDEQLVAHGFNYVILNAYAHDTDWRGGRTCPDDYGPPPLYAWGGTNEKPDHSRFNLDYWQHYDRVIEAMHRRDIVAHIMIKVYNKRVRWPQLRSAEDDLYFRWLIARYAAFPNVVWDYSKEAHYQSDLNYKRFRLRFIQQLDPYQRLRTVHDDTANYNAGHYNDLLDYRSDQQHNRWRQTILSQREQRSWPVVNVEFGYEHATVEPIAGRKTEQQVQVKCAGKGSYNIICSGIALLLFAEHPTGKTIE